MRPGRVAAVKELSPRFRWVDFEGDALKDIAWEPGQKIQISVGGGLTARTYTPILWDARAGHMRILGFAHGDGPGSNWLQALRVGQICQFLGPRRSLVLSDIAVPTTLFGDETSFGLAASLCGLSRTKVTTCVFEVSDAAESRLALESFGMDNATLIERQADDAHLDVTEDAVARNSAAGGCFILTGKASSIQRISRTLKAAGVGTSRLKAKAYWAPGKIGLD